jgi:2-amino-4-hydroxy-6-hydroxymethyldihydropteridine diphosphokinase
MTLLIIRNILFIILSNRAANLFARGSSVLAFNLIRLNCRWVAKEVEKLVIRVQAKTLEWLAVHIAEYLLTHTTNVGRVDVMISKPSAITLAKASQVVVTRYKEQVAHLPPTPITTAAQAVALSSGTSNSSSSTLPPPPPPPPPPPSSSSSSPSTTTATTTPVPVLALSSTDSLTAAHSGQGLQTSNVIPSDRVVSEVESVSPLSSVQSQFPHSISSVVTPLSSYPYQYPPSTSYPASLLQYSGHAISGAADALSLSTTTQRPRRFATVYLSLGSNLGDRVSNLHRAIEALETTEDAATTTQHYLSVKRVACLYESPPHSSIPQPSFLNTVVQIETSLTPEELLVRLQDIEHRLGRNNDTHRVRHGPRPIDIDILYYDDIIYQTSVLTIPHPQLYERDFVLRPLLEYVPRLVPIR